MSQKLAHLKRVYDELGKKRVKVGFFSQSKYPDGTPIAYVAAIQELGYPAGGIPPRPFMRPAINENQAKYRELLARAAQAAINGNLSVVDGLTQVGSVAAGDIKLAIRAVTTPPLKDSTVKARAGRHSKGTATNKPLVDTGQMLQAVAFSVEDK
ncbi:hypothetical protein PSI23_18245 [Xenorhabdus sp. XENO-10]|uniref:Bacteriophage protein n=1 Tax=Xenorhabdus yunnanensis TaxID=3025878 RepID=A0ABT5LJ81_9GAMM|nr:hypothetical protein [Xenorhabdus yunnanensis]MDC9591176.1 hypothetical protein [Xenorhabdus yunnanensis]